MLCDSHTIWTTAVQTSSVSRPPRPSTTTAKHRHGLGRTSGSPFRTINLFHPGTGSITHTEMQPRAGQTSPAQTIFTSPTRRAGDILLFAILLPPPKATFWPGRSTAASQPFLACVLFLACVGSTRSPQIGERGPPTPFFLRQSCSGPSWRSLAGGPAKPLRSSCF